jgi:flagellar protein FliO/FliZ
MTAAAILKLVLALAFVLTLIGGAALIARRLGLAHVKPAGSRRRLAVVEVLSLDARRRLVLVRRDDTEHLLLIGTPAEAVVVERNIAAGFERELARQLPAAPSEAEPDKMLLTGGRS